MNAPYMGKFKVSQEFKGASVHDGLDLVGLDSKEIHCVKAGKVIFAGWENASNHKQGFGQYVKVLVGEDVWYYGHLKEICVKVGQAVNVTDVIGIEGSTGHSTGSHLHICVRPKGIKAKALNVADVLKIPNKLGIYDDGYKPQQKEAFAEYTVKAGDSLWSISLKLLGKGSRYTEILNANDLKIDLLRVGQKLKIPKK